MAQEAVDKGRWFYNWLENKPDRSSVRESHLATRSIGRLMAWTIFSAEITSEGVTVRSPFDEEDGVSDELTYSDA